ncbi:sugar-binding transcriptional regulator [Hutsoniella sourekii]
MKDVFSLLQAVVPDVDEVFNKRLRIMFTLAESKSRIGRQMLAKEVQMTERSLRTNIDYLKGSHIVDTTRQGIQLTDYGRRLLTTIQDELVGSPESYRLYDLEHQLRDYLGIAHCVVIPGNAEEDSLVYQLMGRAVQQLLIRHLKLGECVVAVTGGSTLANIATAFSPDLSYKRDLTFVPTRGGFGGTVEIQSNSVGGLMAERTRSNYVPLFMPENLAIETSELLLKDPSIARAIEMSRQADCLLLSVGQAEVMAQRRDITDDQQQAVINQEAVGEAFGTFYDLEGNPVVTYPRIGLQLADLEHIPLIITVVGGASKAQAIKGFYQLIPSRGWLVCDASLANMVLNGGTL